MLLIQMTGLSGTGKTTLSQKAQTLLENQGLKVEIIDGDVYRKTLCKDLGFSKKDRYENIRRLGSLAYQYVNEGTIAIVAAINPYEEIRKELKENYGAKTVWIKCDLDILIKRDTKGLYKKAQLPDGHPEKILNLTGVNDTYEIPVSPDLTIDTGIESADQSADRLYQFIYQLSNQL